MPPQVLGPGGGHRDERASSRRAMTRDETTVVDAFPNGQPRTRRPPRIDNVGVRAGVGAHPFEEVDNEGVDGVGHSGPCGLSQAAGAAAMLAVVPRFDREQHVARLRSRPLAIRRADSSDAVLDDGPISMGSPTRMQRWMSAARSSRSVRVGTA